MESQPFLQPERYPAAPNDAAMGAKARVVAEIGRRGGRRGACANGVPFAANEGGKVQGQGPNENSGANDARSSGPAPMPLRKRDIGDAGRRIGYVPVGLVCLSVLGAESSRGPCRAQGMSCGAMPTEATALSVRRGVVIPRAPGPGIGRAEA